MFLCKLYLNGIFQDSIDLFLGNFAVDDTDGPTPLRVQKDWKFLTVSIFLHSQQDPVRTLISISFLILISFRLQLPIIMLVAFSMCIVCLLMAGKFPLSSHLSVLSMMNELKSIIFCCTLIIQLSSLYDARYGIITAGNQK